MCINSVLFWGFLPHCNNLQDIGEIEVGIGEYELGLLMSSFAHQYAY